MKKFYSLFLLSLIASTLTAQTTRRVNGDPDITGVNVYNTIQAAVDAANTDDVILIEPYGENLGVNPSYGETVMVDKRIHFRGNGYNLTNPQLSIIPLDTRVAYVAGITFTIGSGASSVSNLDLGSISIFSPNVKIESSKISGLAFHSTENPSVIITEGVGSIIRKCLVSAIYDQRSALSIANSNLNMTVENTGIHAALYYTDNSIFKNCKLSAIIDVDNSIFTNCIFESQFVGVVGGSYNSFNNAISYCISFANDLPTLGNNTNNAAWQQVYIGAQYNSTAFVGENDRVLSNSSIAKNAGLNGGDIGVYGGTYPYELSGLPHHPISTFFINSGIGNNSIDIDAVITIKAN
jgi:hypothetical protein